MKLKSFDKCGVGHQVVSPDEVMELLEPFRLALAQHFRTIDIQPLQKFDLASGETSEEVIIRLIK